MAQKLLQLLLIILIASTVLSYVSFNFILSNIEKNEQANEKYLLNDIRSQINLSFKLLDKLLVQKKQDYLKLHKFAQTYLLQNSHLPDFPRLQAILEKKSGFPVELYIINDDLKIIETSFPPDLGLDFSASPFKNIKSYLHKIKQTRQTMVGQPNIEFISKKIKIYSVSMLDDNRYLELAFIDPDINDYFKKLIDYTSRREDAKISLFIEFWNNILMPMDFIPEKITDKKIALFQKFRQKTRIDQQAFKHASSEGSPYQIQTTDSQDRNITSYYLQLAGLSHPYIKQYSSRYLAKVVFDHKKVLLIKKQFKLFLLFSLALTISGIVIFALYIRHWLITPLNLVLSAIQKKSPVDIKKPLTESPEIKKIAVSYNETLQHLRKSMDELERQSTRDPLTGIDNRRKFIQSFKQELLRARRHQTVLALAMIDLDNFKKYNDIHGHQQGDRLLIDFSRQLKKRFLRPSDHQCRMGGDEFSVLLIDIEPSTIKSTFKDLQQSWDTHFQSNLVNNKGEAEIAVTLSIGIYTFSSQHPEQNWKKAYHQADTALYRAKNKGRNRVEIIEDSSQQTH